MGPQQVIGRGEERVPFTQFIRRAWHRAWRVGSAIVVAADLLEAELDLDADVAPEQLDLGDDV